MVVDIARNSKIWARLELGPLFICSGCEGKYSDHPEAGPTLPRGRYKAAFGVPIPLNPARR